MLAWGEVALPVVHEWWGAWDVWQEARRREGEGRVASGSLGERYSLRQEERGPWSGNTEWLDE